MKIRSLEDVSFISRHPTKVLTLFSGGLDSSYVLKILADLKCDVTALAIDLGDGINLEDLSEIANHFGAKLKIIDGRNAFANDAVLPAIQAQAKYMGMYPISSSLSRPIIARYAVETARAEGCDAIIHTANQSQNSLRRLNGAIEQLGFTGYYGSPYEYSAMTREQKMAELCKSGLPKFQARGISGDANLWCREYESGALDNPEDFRIPEELFEWSVPCDAALSNNNEIDISYSKGIPVALNGEPLPLVELIARLNYQAGSFGIGRYCGLEHLEQGEKVLEVREAPAAQLLMDAYRHLEMATINAELLREKLSLEQVWVREAVEGRWYGALRTATQQFIANTANTISGSITYRMRTGAFDVCSIRAQSPRYLKERDQWELQAAQVRGSRTLEQQLEAA